MASAGPRRRRPHHAARRVASPRTRMYAVPERRCARPPTGWARGSARPACASSPRPPSRASSPRSSSGFSRAVGETMIVAIAAGGIGGAVFNLNPCLPGQTMTAAMTVAGHRLGPVARRRGEPALREPLLRGPAAVRHDARAEPRQRALRPARTPEGGHLMASAGSRPSGPQPETDRGRPARPRGQRRRTGAVVIWEVVPASSR